LRSNSLEAETDSLIKKNMQDPDPELRIYNTGSRDSGTDPDLGKLMMFASGSKPTFHDQNYYVYCTVGKKSTILTFKY